MIRSGWWDYGWLSFFPSFFLDFPTFLVSFDIKKIPIHFQIPAYLYCSPNVFISQGHHQGLPLFTSALGSYRAHPPNTCFLDLPEVLAKSANSKLSARNFQERSLRISFLTSLQVIFLWWLFG